MILKNCGIMKPLKNSAFFLDVFHINFQQSFSFFVQKPGGVKSSSEAEDRGWSVVITTRIHARIWDQWRHSGVSRRENPPCFWRHCFMPSTSSRYIIAQWNILTNEKSPKNITLNYKIINFPTYIC